MEAVVVIDVGRLEYTWQWQHTQPIWSYQPCLLRVDTPSLTAIWVWVLLCNVGHVGVVLSCYGVPATF